MKLFAINSPHHIKEHVTLKKMEVTMLIVPLLLSKIGIIFIKLKVKHLVLQSTPVIACNHCSKLNSTVIDLKKKLHEKEKY